MVAGSPAAAAGPPEPRLPLTLALGASVAWGASDFHGGLRPSAAGVAVLF